MTNYEKIKNMSVEEMAKFMDIHSNYPCRHCIGCESNIDCEQGIRKWLESEAENENRS